MPVVPCPAHDSGMESDRTASHRNWRRPFWILGHAVLVSSLVLFVIGYVQAATAPPDEWFAGGEMNGYSVITVMIALVIYALVGLWAVIDEIRHPVLAERPAEPSSEAVRPDCRMVGAQICATRPTRAAMRGSWHGYAGSRYDHNRRDARVL
jgi:hypothetical protein